MNWRPIETMPEQLAVDVWIRSSNNENYGRRACHVCVVDGNWFGKDAPQFQFGEYPTHWMNIPCSPDAALLSAADTEVKNG